MEVRQVQMTGGTTFAVSLPKKWAVRQGLKQGDQVGIVAESDGSLRIVHLRQPSDEKRRMVLRVEGLRTGALARRIVGAYLAGFDVVQVEGTPSLTVEQKEVVRRIAARLVGPQIVEETDQIILLEDLLDPKDFSLLRGLKRMHVLVRGMVQDALEVVSSRNTKTVSDLAQRDDEVDRLYWLVLKQYYMILKDPLFGMKLELDPKRAVGKLLAARLLERIGDHAELIGTRALALDPTRVPPELLERMKDLGKAAVLILDEAFQSLLNRDPDAADHAIEETLALRDLQKLVLDRATTLETEVGVPLAFLLESIDRMAAYSTGIAEMAINAHLLEAPGQVVDAPRKGIPGGHR